MNKTRLEAFSDGVFSIVMTLLIFNIKIPILAKPFTDADLWGALEDVWPLLSIYFLTFVVLSVFWINHHVLFESFAKSVDRRLNFLNLLYLMFVVLVPFTASLWGTYSSHQPAAILYGINIFIVLVISTWMGYYIRSSPELAHDEINAHTLKHVQFRSRVSLALYIIGIALSLVHPILAAIFYLLPVFFNIFPKILYTVEHLFGVYLD